MLNCQGGSNQSSAPVIYDNLFYVKDNTLVCALGTDSEAAAGVAEEPLINGVTDFSIEYGVETSDTGSVSRYLKAASVSDWNAVLSIRVTLTFANPLAGQPGQPDVVQTKYVIKLIGVS